jgi:hypothetical protein
MIMTDLRDCPECGETSPTDHRYCTCGHDFETKETPAGQDSRPALEIPSFAYRTLNFAISVIRVLTILYVANALLSLFSSLLPKAGPLFVLVGFIDISVRAFFMWVSTDVIRILLDIRVRLDA